MSPGGLLLLQELSAESKKGAELHGAAQSGGGGVGGVGGGGRSGRGSGRVLGQTVADALY